MPQQTGPLTATRLGAAAIDLGVAALVLLLGLLATAPSAIGQGLQPPDALGYLLIILGAAALVLRRRLPMIMIGVVATATALYLALGYAWGPILLAIPIAAYAVARALPPRTTVITEVLAVAVIIIGVVVRVARGADSWDWVGLFALLGLIIAPAIAGGAVRAVRRSAEQLRAEQARRIATDERLRLAREVHDVVGHGLAVIAMQSGVALHLLPDDQVQARDALEAIRTTSRESLADLRQELAQLSDPNDAPMGGDEPVRSVDFDLLAERLRSDGRTVEVDVAGAETLPMELRRLSFRIVREAVTNVVRHAGAAAVTITVRTGNDQLRVEVVDTGRSSAAGIVEGQGIRGMRERVEAQGGAFSAGPLDAGGFAVRAVIPIVQGRS